VTLSDLRKVSIKKNLRIRFSLSNGMECVVSEHGVAHVPALHTAPAFNLEEEAAQAREFLVEPTASTEKHKARKSRRYGREEMAALVAAAPGAKAGPDEHEE
jgi:hypothetical protein